MKVSDKELKKYLREYFGFDNFKGKQEEAIKSLLEENDTFVLMPTGGGKSLCYQLPALILPGTAIIISPLIALMKNQVDNLRSFHTADTVAHFLNSSLSKREVARIKKDILEGKTKLLYVAPEFFAKEDNILFLRQVDISFYAVDEAHCISEWGHDFRPDYRNIRPNINRIKRRPIIALTATATPKVQQDILKNLDILDAKIVKSSFFRPNLYYEVRAKFDIDRQILQIIQNHPSKSGIIYCLRRDTVDKVAKYLQSNGIKALPYHAGLDSATRTKHQDMFLNEKVDVIVATIAFGMGIDKPDIRYVIHYDMPKSLEAYYQETGRAGRDGLEAKCIAFYSEKDIQKLETFLQKRSISEQEIGRQLIFETVSYVEAPVCRAKMLLNYFGEDLDHNCEHCDNCLSPTPEFDGTEATINVLKAVKEVKERFNAVHVAKVLVGKDDSNLKTYNHHKISVFGIGKDKSEKFWIAVIRQLLILKLLEKDIENYGILKLTKKGKEFLKQPYAITLREPRDYSKQRKNEEKNDVVIAASSADPKLMSLLKDLRRKIAREHKIAPFVIFSDATLEEMSIFYPIKESELKKIIGVSEGKIKKYGKPFLDLIAKYVEEEEIIRPTEFPVVDPNKVRSKLKIEIIKSIDKKMDFEDICEALRIECDTLLDEIESIVNAGLPLNIDYYVDKMIEDYRQEEIWEYFKEAENDSIYEALKELNEFSDDEYTEDEIRLVRIKYATKNYL